MSETPPRLTAQDWVDLRTRLFLDDKLEALASHFATPLDVRLEGRDLRLASQHDLRDALGIRRQKLHEIGVRRMKGLVVAEGILRQGRGKVHVDWIYDLGPASMPRISRAVYETAWYNDMPMVARVDFQSLAFAGVPDWFAGQTALKLRA
jgi:hypothetical protein